MSLEFIAALVFTNIGGAIAAWVALNSRVSANEQLTDTIRSKIEKHDHAIYGNGRKGLNERVTVLESTSQRKTNA
ncbi:hypothetical protein [Rosistilla oblonga]|uniref:Uncharacterized protein n=1 Tax=Rosistilla oblonga TaxID=2527990 RepID=A0A518ITW3_9BACT|nr:hypothetical protein [Rosistilla oblonga]QDV56500.1 hypothetical protein Mal33_24910 [Rosistilla oblonga]